MREETISGKRCLQTTEVYERGDWFFSYLRAQNTISSGFKRSNFLMFLATKN